MNRLQPVATGLMALALALSPAYVVRPHIGPLPTTVLEIALGVAIVVGLVAFWRELPWRNPYTWAALLLLVAATIDTVLSPDRRSALGTWKAYFIEPALAGLIIAAMATRRDRARWLLAGLGVAGMVVALANIDLDVPRMLSGHFNVVTPPVAIYQTSNAVPLYLEPLVAFGLAIVLMSEVTWERALAALFVVAAGLAIVLSYSRAGWMTLGALVVFVALFTRIRWWLIGAVVVIGGAAFALSHSVRQRILVQFDFNSPDNTIGLRKDLWQSALAMLTHHPIFGGGLDGFKTALQPYKVSAYHEDLIYPHNIVLNFWSETGLLGLAAFCWVIVQVVRQAIRGLRVVDSPWARAMAVGLLALVVAFLVHGMVDVPYFKNDQALAFWALLGVQLGSLQVKRPRP